MLFGVTIPCILSIFSVILFLRLGFVLGQVCFLLFSLPLLTTQGTDLKCLSDLKCVLSPLGRTSKLLYAY